MKREEQSESFRRTALWVLLSGACYYLATQIAWALCFPNSKVSLFFPPHAVLVSVLLLVPTRHWWAYTLAAIGGHFLATQQAHWPFFYSLHCEAFDAVQNVATAAGLRLFIKSPLKLITLRDAIVFVLIAVIIVPFGTAFWGAAFTISNGFGTHYWIEWRNLGISNGVTAIVLIPAFLYGIQWISTRSVKVTLSRLLEAAILGMGIVVSCVFAFDWEPAGPAASPALLYAPIPLLIWAAVRFGLGGASVSMLIITFQAIWGTMHGRGPFLTQSPAENVLGLQLFLLMAGTPTRLLAVLLPAYPLVARRVGKGHLSRSPPESTAPRPNPASVADICAAAPH
jgi:integral membrane sensor domain MASE1